MTSITARISRLPRDLEIFLIATFLVGLSSSLYDSVFNNFLNDRFTLSGFQRAFLELPRELPGFLVVFVSAGLWFVYSRRLGVVAILLSAVGALLIGVAAYSYGIMVIWLFVYSMGGHMMIPLNASIGMELARAGRAGRRLGQLNAVRNLAVISGSALVFIGFRFLKMDYTVTFVLAAVGFCVAAGFMLLMSRGERQPARLYLKMRWPYRWYYLLSMWAGARKQIYITFAPWLLVNIFGQPTQVIATLITIGGLIGIVFQPFLGWATDRFGERLILCAEGVFLVIVCLGYGFSASWFGEAIALYIIFASYLVDQMLFSFSIARSTYIKKIAIDPADVQPALTLAVTIDHVFSITVALLGGLIWNRFGYQYVFLLGVGIAALNFVTALQVKVPLVDQK